MEINKSASDFIVTHRSREEKSKTVLSSQKLKKSEIILILAGGFLSFLSILLGQIVGEVASGIISILYIIFAMTKPNKQRIGFVLIGVVNTKTLAIGSISASVIICFLTCALDLISNRKVNKKILMISLIYFLYCLQYCFRPAGIMYGIIFPIKMIAVINYFYLLSKESDFHTEPFLFLMRLFYFYSTGLIFAVFGSAFSDSIRFSIEGNDPNALAVQTAFLIAVLCVLYFRFKCINTLNFGVFAFILSVICFLTGSRTGILLISIIIVLTFLCNIRRLGKLWILFLGLFVVAIFIIFSSVGQSAIETLINRQEAMISRSDITNGRTNIWMTYVDFFNSNKLYWLFGLGNFAAYGINYVAHNFLIEGIAATGIVGVVLSYSLLMCVFINLKNNVTGFIRKKSVDLNLFVSLPLLIPLVGNLMLHELTNIYNVSMLFMGVVIISANMKNKQ